MAYSPKNDRKTSLTLGGTKDASAILDVTSTSQGVGFPNMTELQRDAISTPKDGLTIYNTDTDKLNYYDGATNSWAAVGSGSGAGSKNYIEGGDGEAGVTGWIEYTDRSTRCIGRRQERRKDRATLVKLQVAGRS